MRQVPALVPDYYPKFRCLGSDCEDTCCYGWRVDIDKKTYKLYKQNLHKELAPIFKSAIKRREGGNDHAYAVIKMNDKGYCPLLDENRLCRVHQAMGLSALCHTCRIFPRMVNRVGGQDEYLLSLACPETSRLILLNREPMGFSVQAMPGTTNYTRFFLEGMAPALVETFSKVRALCIAILQRRSLSIDARLMFLGIFVERLDAACAIHSGNLAEAAGSMDGVCEEFVATLAHDAEIQAEFERFPDKPELKLVLFLAVLRHTNTLIADTQSKFRRSVNEAMAGLGFAHSLDTVAEATTKNYREAYATYFKPFFDENAHILENMLVHRVMRMAFPLQEQSMSAQYRELVCTYLIAKVVLTGTAACHLVLDEARVIRFFLGFNRLTDHNPNYTKKIVETLEEKNLADMQQFLLLLKEDA